MTEKQTRRAATILTCVLAISMVLSPIEALAASSSSSSEKASSSEGKKTASSSSEEESEEKNESSSEADKKSSSSEDKKKSSSSSAKKSSSSKADKKSSSSTTSKKTSSTSDKAKVSEADLTSETESVKSGIKLMQAWSKKNSDVMGYLNIPGTNIDYPVVQTANNADYNTMGYDKKYSKNGVIWADQDVNSTSRNIILYGHNWTNYTANPRIGNPQDVMFGQLTAYHHESFANEHPYIYYSDDANGDAKWEVFATFYTTDLRFYLGTSGSQKKVADKAKKLSLRDYGVSVGDSDKILTLSTCTRYLGKFPAQRFIVMARKVPETKAPEKKAQKTTKVATAPSTRWD